MCMRTPETAVWLVFVRLKRVSRRIYNRADVHLGEVLSGTRTCGYFSLASQDSGFRLWGSPESQPGYASISANAAGFCTCVNCGKLLISIVTYGFVCA